MRILRVREITGLRFHGSLHALSPQLEESVQEVTAVPTPMSLGTLALPGTYSAC